MTEKKTVVIQFRIGESMKGKIEKLAAEADRTVSDYCRIVLEKNIQEAFPLLSESKTLEFPPTALG